MLARMARIRRVRTVNPIAPAKCKRAALRLFDAILTQPETSWRRETYLGTLGGFDEYHGRIAWRLGEQGTRYSVEFDDALLRRVDERIRGLEYSSAEDSLWTAIVRISKDPLPRDIALGLIERRAYFTTLALANSNQHPDVHWAAAERDTQARNRMATRVMADATFGPDDVTRFLERYGDDYTARRLMARVRDCSEEKRARLEAYDPRAGA